jgi:hypothetical protein
LASQQRYPSCQAHRLGPHLLLAGSNRRRLLRIATQTPSAYTALAASSQRDRAHRRGQRNGGKRHHITKDISQLGIHLRNGHYRDDQIQRDKHKAQTRRVPVGQRSARQAPGRQTAVRWSAARWIVAARRRVFRPAAARWAVCQRWARQMKSRCTE